jgi:CheY-like chemotaxis protein
VGIHAVVRYTGPVRLLLIEDESDSLELMQMLLQVAGFDAVGVPTKAEAIRDLQTNVFDLVIADLLVGTKDLAVAWTNIDEIVALARPAPVGLITGWNVSEDLATKHGASFVLRKPCSRETLFAQLGAALRLPPLSEIQTSMVEAYFRSIEQRAYSRLGELCTDDVVYQLPGENPRFSHEIRGRAAFLELTDKTFSTFQQPRFELGEMRPLPNGAMVEYVGTWHEANKQRSMPGAVMFEFRDGQIARIGVRVKTDRLG